jgi:hypothetical protein
VCWVRSGHSATGIPVIRQLLYRTHRKKKALLMTWFGRGHGRRAPSQAKAMRADGTKENRTHLCLVWDRWRLKKGGENGRLLQARYELFVTQSPVHAAFDLKPKKSTACSRRRLNMKQYHQNPFF